MPGKETITILEPKPYSEVGLSFTIYGVVPLSWLASGSTVYLSIPINHMDGMGKILSGTSIDFNLPPDVKKLDLTQGFKFAYTEQLNYNLLSFIEKTHGRMAIKFTGRKEGQVFYLPLIVKGLEPEGGADPKIVAIHSNIEQVISQYEKDISEYHKRLGEIYEKRQKEFEARAADKSEPYTDVQENSIAEGMFEILQYSEDPEIRELEQKYKDAREWMGPLVRGRVRRWSGFDFRVYSNDHGQHFHVIHKERGIDARFSFPEIQLINYKNSQNNIPSKVQEAIRTFFQNPENFKKLENEFQKKIL